eukprot:757514-Hanusia_phi.AAC.2
MGLTMLSARRTLHSKFTVVGWLFRERHNMQSVLGNVACTQCPTGSTTLSTGSTSSTECLCNVNYYYSSGSCLVCPSNSAKTFIGNNPCACDAGYSGNGITCDACPLGDYKSEPGNFPCIQCVVDTARRTPPQPLPGTVSVGLVSSTMALLVWNAMLVITKIQPGIMPVHSAVLAIPLLILDLVRVPNVSDFVSNLACTQCPSGSTTISMTSVDVSDYVCDVGRYFDGTSCSQCDIGYYKDTKSNSACTQCPPGSSTVNVGSSTLSSCVCAAGYYLSGCVCIQCAIGYYKSSKSNSACTACNIGIMSGNQPVLRYKVHDWIYYTASNSSPRPVQCM